MADVKLLESQRLADNPDGGGQMTATEVPDNQVNNLFGDISRINRVNGNVSIRKVFALAQTNDTATFAGAHSIVAQPPLDPAVSALVFSTDSWTDTRDAAKNAIESFLVAGPAMRMYLYDQQVEGQRSITVLQRPDLPLPEIGHVYVLDQAAPVVQQQYVRATSVTHSVQTFTDSQGDYTLRVITIGINSPLNATFAGEQPHRVDVFTRNTTIRDTNPADAAKYYGVQQLTSDASASDLSVTLDSIYGQLVPSTTGESPVTNVSTGQVKTFLDAATAAVSVGSAFQVVPTSVGKTYVMPSPVVPGSMTSAESNMGTVSDDAAGTLSSSTYGDFATIDYESGTLTMTRSGIGYFNPKYIPAAIATDDSQTNQISITQSTRGYVYTSTLIPLPEPGSVSVSFRAAGQWYTLTDATNDGQLTGEPGTGGGSVSYVTGGLSVTLGALPDIGSSVIFSWGTPSQYQIQTGNTEIQPPRIQHTASAGNIDPGSLEITWTVSGTDYTATDNGAGVISGDATGNVVYGSGDIGFVPTELAAPDTVFHIAYTAGDIQTELFSPSKSGSTITMTVADGPIRPRSLLITYQQTATTVYGFSATTTQVLTDNGSGVLVDAAGDNKSGSIVNYTTGEISFNPDFTVVMPVLTYERFARGLPSRTADPDLGYFASQAQFGSWPAGSLTGDHPVHFADGSNVTVQYKKDSASDDAHSEDVDSPPVSIDLVPDVSSDVVQGSVMFGFGGDIYVDRSGSLYRSLDVATGAGTLAGSISYATGQATITDWNAGASPSLSLKALLTQPGQIPVSVVTFRTPGSPLRPASLYIQATLRDGGTLISATADVNGKINTSNMHGYVNVTMGVASVAFGAYVLDSSLTTDEKLEPWYDSADVDGDGYIWQPKYVVPGSIKYSCVVQTYLPLAPEILGLDPVRLPLDGRVQIFRPGDTLVFREPLTYTCADPLSAGDEITLPRDGLEDIVMYDSDAVAVDPALYTPDPEAGTITMATPLDLSAYTEPLVAVHTIADMALCTDAQITGQISFSPALTHDYPAATSYVSNALVHGDLQARYEHLFEQKTWSNGNPNWTDAVIGDSTTAQYNELDYPIQVLNQDAITMKWALVFTSSTGGNIVGEQLGVIGTFSTSANVAPLQPSTGNPYFVLDSDGFGSGWSTGNAIRFNTIGAGAPMWFVRTVLSGPATETDDKFLTQLRWDKD